MAIDAWFDDFKLSSQAMPQAFVPRPTASLLTSVFEQAWRWLQAQFASWFGQPQAAALLSEPPAGRVWRSYYFVGSQRIALREQTSSDPTGQVSYLLSDHLGSTTALVSPNGVVLSRQRYSSWGKTIDGGVSTAYQYTGQRNTGLGIYYYGARFNDPTLGRFLTPDTIIPQPGNPQDWDRYSYVQNNPINATDPSGHMAWDGCTGEVGGCGSGSNYADYVYSVWHTDQERQQNNKNLQAETYNPDGSKDSIALAIGLPTNLNARNRNDMKIPTILYWGLSIVYDRTGGIQVYSETLDITFDPRLQFNDGEKANPSELLGVGVSVTKGLIWKENFNTEQYLGEATSWGGG